MIKPKSMDANQQKILDIELKFVRGDRKAIPQITITFGALIELYAKDLGFIHVSEINLPERKLNATRKQYKDKELNQYWIGKRQGHNQCRDKVIELNGIKV